MSLFAIADLHLSTSDVTDKSMEVFGPRWAGYTERLRSAWEAIVAPSDTVVIGGDISWALTPEEATADLHYIDRLPGRKILLKGNHDYWWPTTAKLSAFKEKEALTSLSFLFNCAFLCEDVIICGTRGWYHDPTADGARDASADYEKIVAREAGRLRLSLEAGRALDAGEGRETVVFLHFPVKWGAAVCEPILQVLCEYGIRRCYFGHIHGAAPTSFTLDGIEMTLIAADALSFVPRLVPMH